MKGEIMPRPCKKRRVCSNPGEKLFGPKGVRTKECIELTVDEYETLRLIDVLGVNQQQCAKSMDVARSTVQSIYASARKKLSTALIKDINIKVNGGDFILCNGEGHCCHKDSCCQK